MHIKIVVKATLSYVQNHKVSGLKLSNYFSVLLVLLYCSCLGYDLTFSRFLSLCFDLCG